MREYIISGLIFTVGFFLMSFCWSCGRRLAEKIFVDLSNYTEGYQDGWKDATDGEKPVFPQP